MEKEFKLKKFTNGMHYLSLDDETVSSLTIHNNKRVIGTLNNQFVFHCAILSHKEVGHYVTIGLTLCKKLKIKEGSFLKASFIIDTSKYQFEMPEELAEVLRSDEVANRIFHELTEGNQRGLIFLVQQVKSVDKKIERALKIATQLKNGIHSPKTILK